LKTKRADQDAAQASVADETPDAEFVKQVEGDDAKTQAKDLRHDELRYGLGPPRFLRQHDASLSRRRGGDDAKLSAVKTESRNRRVAIQTDVEFNRRFVPNSFLQRHMLDQQAGLQNRLQNMRCSKHRNSEGNF
jgi:hypothetical protein